MDLLKTGIQEMHFYLHVLFQFRKDMSYNIHACFINYQKAFDTITHEKRTEFLVGTEMEDKDPRMIRKP